MTSRGAAEQSSAGDAQPSMLSPTIGLCAGPGPLTLVSFAFALVKRLPCLTPNF